MTTSEFKDLSSEEQKLVFATRSAQDLAYAPYSNFFVGCAILLQNGEVFHGANQENASYPLCLCAERVALSYVAMHRPEVAIKAIGISTSAKLSKGQVPAPPCGACRQVIMEYQSRQKERIAIYLAGFENKVWIYESIDPLLPHSFGSEFFE